MKHDFYMNNSNAVDRLVEEWVKYKSLIVAYDFDNTVFDFHNEGHSYEYVINLLRECKKLGAYLIVFTASDKDRHQFIKKYLDNNSIPYDGINENKPDLPFKDGKIYYNILLDDRAGLESAVNVIEEAISIIKEKMEEN